jgi:hypothetical protein
MKTCQRSFGGKTDIHVLFCLDNGVFIKLKKPGPLQMELDVVTGGVSALCHDDIIWLDSTQ